MSLFRKDRPGSPSAPKPPKKTMPDYPENRPELTHEQVAKLYEMYPGEGRYVLKGSERWGCGHPFCDSHCPCGTYAMSGGPAPFLSYHFEGGKRIIDTDDLGLAGRLDV